MKAKLLIIILLFTPIIISSCSTSRDLIEKEKTEQGITKFYVEKESEDNLENRRLLASVNNGIYYGFYPDRIVKKTRENKGLIYTLNFEELPAEILNSKSFEKLSAADSLILSRGSKILNSLGWRNHKRPVGASGFLIEVEYYHGYPKGKKFRPFAEI